MPLAAIHKRSGHLAMLEDWLRSYRSNELFDVDGRPREAAVDWLPTGDRRLGANPHTNGGRDPRDLSLPDFRDYAVPVPTAGGTSSEPTRILGGWLRDVMRANADNRNFRIVGPDEAESNRLQAVYEVTGKAWQADNLPFDEHLDPHGKVLEILSEHTCQGWLEGYILTGRHGLFSCYEAFVHLVDSMFNQHAKWLKVIRGLHWRRPIPSLNYLLTSHVWRQDHNGFCIRTLVSSTTSSNKKAEVIRV